MKQIKILVVDDHSIVRQGLKQILADSQSLVVAGEASTGQEALQKIRSSNFDMVIMDISLPDRSGLDMLEQIKMIAQVEMRKRHNMLAIFLTGMHRKSLEVASALTGDGQDGDDDPEGLGLGVGVAGGHEMVQHAAKKLVWGSSGCAPLELDDDLRSHSIATLRAKAVEHSFRLLADSRPPEIKMA